MVTPTIAKPPAGAGQTEAYTADITVAGIMGIITDSITAHPRSLQKRIGPSEIGMDCTRRLIHKLAGDTEPDRGIAWKPTVGTACHTQMEEWFGAHKDEGYLVEQRVTVGQIGGVDITGSTDLFSVNDRTVIDWKFVGPAMLKKYKASGPSNQYRVQAHLYGTGWVNAGYEVEQVMIAFLPRDGELGDAYFWWEPYQPEIAEVALAKANQLVTLINAIGEDATLAMYPLCNERFCPWCPADKAKQNATI